MSKKCAAVNIELWKPDSSPMLQRSLLVLVGGVVV